MDGVIDVVPGHTDIDTPVTTGKRAQARARAAPPTSGFLPDEKRGPGRPRTAGDRKAFPPHRIARIDTLIPYAGNPRTHTKAQIDKIAASIKEFGFTNPLLVDGKRHVIAGHGRLAAAQQLWMEEVPVIVLGQLTKVQRRALVIADNRLALDAAWDDDLLRFELGELATEGFAVELTGFGEHEIASLMGEETATAPAPRPSTVLACPHCGHEFDPRAKPAAE